MVTGREPDYEERLAVAAEHAAESLRVTADEAAESLRATADEVAAEAAARLSEVAERAAERLVEQSEVATEVSKLNETMSRLIRQSEADREQIKKGKRRDLALGVVYLLDIALTIALTFLIGSAATTSRRLEQNVEDIQRITATQSILDTQVLCPLYKLFIDAYNPASIPASGRAHYEQQFVVIRRGYQVLSCVPPLPTTP